MLVLPDPGPAGPQTWFVRIVCRPDAADALADALAARDDVSWVSVTSGGSEMSCVTRSNPDDQSARSCSSGCRGPHQVLELHRLLVLHMHVGGDAEWLAFDDPLTRRAGRGAARRGARPVPDRAPAVALRDDDAPLLAALARDGRAGVVALARDAPAGRSPGSSPRLDELMTSGAIGCELDLAPDLFGFHSSGYLWMTVAPGELHATGEALSLHPRDQLRRRRHRRRPT